MRWPQAGGHPFPIPPGAGRFSQRPSRAKRRTLTSGLGRMTPRFGGEAGEAPNRTLLPVLPAAGGGGARDAGDVAMETSRGPRLRRGRAKYRRMGIQLLGIPVQRNQHYFSQSTFTYIISFILSITQYGFLHFTGNKPKVSVTWPRSRRRLRGFPPLRTTFCNTICAPEAGYAPSIVVRNVFDPPILTPYFHENLMDLEKV